jgi:hypothetical protein
MIVVCVEKGAGETQVTGVAAGHLFSTPQRGRHGHDRSAAKYLKSDTMLPKL